MSQQEPLKTTLQIAEEKASKWKPRIPLEERNKGGRPPIGDRAMTNAEHQKKWRKNHKEEVRQMEARRALSRPYPGNTFKEKEWPRHAVGIDGEGRRNPFDPQRDDYWLLQANDRQGGAGIPDLKCEEGYLRTFDILKWLFDWVYRPRRVVVGYGLSYDWQHWFRDLESADYLGTFKETDERGRGHKVGPLGRQYCIWQIPGKFLQLDCCQTGRRLIVADMLGWTGDSFVKTMASWGILDGSEQAEMQSMKDLRGQFEKLEVSRVVEYNRSEVIGMAEYWTRLDATIRDTFDITLRSWHGGACLAKGLLRSRGLEIANSYSNAPEELLVGIDQAFSGGRIECFRLGHFEGAYVYDINSAYPAASCLLPSPSGTFRECQFNFSIQSGLCEVSWDIRGNNPYWPLTPFHWRDDNGHIHRPPFGRGWYHVCEVRQAAELWGHCIAVHRCFEYVPDCLGNPLGFLEEVYEERQRLNKECPNKGKVLKIGPNSLYGTLCQRPRGKHKPPYRNLFLAGEITARTRAQLLALMALNPREVIYCNTDGVTFSSPLSEFESNKKLGGWSGPEEYSRYCIYQPGVAFRQDAEGGWSALTRGLRKGPALEARKSLEEAWDEAEVMGIVAVSMGDQFVRRRKAIRENAEEEAGKWVPKEKDLRLRPSIGMASRLGEGSSIRRWLTWRKDFDYTKPSKPYRYGTTADKGWEEFRELKREKIQV